VHELHNNDKKPPRSVAEEWHQVAIERAKRIEELEEILEIALTDEEWDAESWGAWMGEAQIVLDRNCN
jgi:hypothetical protein